MPFSKWIEWKEKYVEKVIITIHFATLKLRTAISL